MLCLKESQQGLVIEILYCLIFNFMHMRIGDSVTVIRERQKQRDRQTKKKKKNRERDREGERKRDRYTGIQIESK